MMLSSRIKAPYGVLFVAVAALVLVGTPWDAGAVVQEWASLYRTGSSSMYVYSSSMVGVDANGNVYVGGYGYNVVGSSTYYDYVVVKFNSNGGFQWMRAFDSGGGSSKYNYARGMAVTPAGNVYITGYSTSPTASTYDSATVAYDTNGNQLWAGWYNGPGNSYDYTRTVNYDSSGNVYVHGNTYNGSNYDFVTLKWSPSGTLLWASIHDSGDNDPFNDGEQIAFGTNNDVFVTGVSYNHEGPTSYYDFCLQSLNASNGAQNWVRYFNGNGDSYDICNSVDADSSGNAYVGGYGYHNNSNYDMLVVSWDSAGNQRWVGDVNNGSTDYLYDLEEWNGDVYAIGYGYVGAPRYYDILTAGFSGATGAQKWVSMYDNGTTYSNYRYDYGYALEADQYGVYSVGYGYVNRSQYYYYDWTTVAYDNTTGAELWLMRFNGPRSYYDYARAVASDNNGCVYPMGTSYSSSYQEFAVVKYCEEFGCTEVEAKAGGPYTIECTGQRTAFTVDGSRSCEPNDLPLTFDWDTNCPGGLFDGSTSATTTLTVDGPPPCPVNCSASLTVENPRGESDTDVTAVVVQDTTAPTWDYFPPNYSWECDRVQSPSTVTATDICDPDVPVMMNERVSCGSCDGNYTLYRDYATADDCGNDLAQTQTVTVQDTTPPVIHNASDENLYCLWSPEHSFYCFTLGDWPMIATDNCETNYTQQCETGEPDITWWIDDVVSDQPDDGTGDGSTIGDVRISENGNWFCVRAERDGSIYYGRHYSVYMRASDDCGNTTDSTLMGQVYIPHDSSDHEDCLNANEGKDL